MEFMKKLKAKCKAEVEAFAKCMEWNSPTLEYRYCRKAQMLFDNCMKEKLQMERPPPNYFNQLRVHNTNRPKPQEDLPKFENPVKGLPDDYPRRDPITNALFV